jgi:hypothetical protein
MKLKKNPKKISRAELKGSLDFHYFIATVIYRCFTASRRNIL